MKIATILDQIDLGSMALPEFQRGFVWNRDQVRGLMHSLYLGHPVGSLLVWVTKTESADARGDGQLAPGSVKLLLDGQQRMTSLYGIIRGRPPMFFDGNAGTFSGLHFNLEEQSFEFYAPMKMKDNPYWINVTELLQQGVGTFIQRIMGRPELADKLNSYINRLTAIENIKQRDLYVEEVTGEEKTVDVVVDIFNCVNSGGTKLSKGDLALARICAAWPEAREELKTRLRKWREAGFHFKLEWLLRCVNTVLTGEALFSALRDVRPAEFRDGLHKAEKAVDSLLNLISSRLGLDHDRVLGGRYAFPLMARYVMDRGGRLQNHRERDRLLFWYVHTALWGRYAGSTESVLNQDLALIEEKDGSLDRLIDGLRLLRGDLSLQAEDFRGWSRGARFYPLLYMLTRVHKARDWDTGIELSGHLLGNLSQLQLHHIFPKSVLYDRGYARPDVNALANFTFLTQETNLLVSNRLPEEYMPEFLEKQPGAIESHWIPTDPELWKVENYAAFLDARRELLATAANEFLDALSAGVMPEPERAVPAVLERPGAAVPGGVADEDEEHLLADINRWITEQGLPEGELVYELVDEESGEPRAVLDLAWPNGLQEGYSQPVAVLLDEATETLEAASKAGYRCFTHPEEFKRYVKSEVLALAGNEGS
jgi:hypothetical protein